MTKDRAIAGGKEKKRREGDFIAWWPEQLHFGAEGYEIVIEEYG